MERTPYPNPTPMNVATAYPSTPVNMAGTTSDRQPLLAAIAAAVVGPPTLALLAMSKSLRFIPSFSPAYTVKYRCVMTCTKLKKNSAGAVDTICLILPLAPIVTKKSCIAKAANASPLGARPPIFLGNAVASATVTRVTMGMIHCTPTPAAPAMYVPKAQIDAATVSA